MPSLAFRKASICSRFSFSASCTLVVNPQHATRSRLILCWKLPPPSGSSCIGIDCRLTLGGHRRILISEAKRTNASRITRSHLPRKLKVTSASSESGGQGDFRFPRFRRKGLESRFSLLPGQFRIGEPLPDDLTNGKIKTGAICDWILASSAIVEPKFLLIQVAE